MAEPTLQEISGQQVSVVINKVSYPLHKLSCEKEMDICDALSLTENEWRTKLNAMDTKTICVSLFHLIKDRETFKEWKDVARLVSSNGFEKFTMLAAVAAAMNQASPDVIAMIDNAKKKMSEAQIRMSQEAIQKMDSLGLESSTSLHSTMGGQSEQSLNLPIEKSSTI